MGPNYEAMTGMANGIKEGMLAYQTQKQIQRTQDMQGLLQGIQTNPQTGVMEYTPQKQAEINFNKQKLASDSAELQRKSLLAQPNSDESLRRIKLAENLTGSKLPQGMSGVDVNESQGLLSLKLRSDNSFMEKMFAADVAKELAEYKATHGGVSGNRGLGKKSESEKNIPQNVYAAATFAKRMKEAQGNIESVIAAGYDPTSIDAKIKSSKYYPEILTDQNQKLMTQAKKNFLTAQLRRESGATISDAEFATGNSMYFPQEGYTDAVLAQKKRNREIAIAGLEAEGAKALPKLEQKLDANTKGLLAKPEAKQDDNILKYSQEHGLPYDQAKQILLKRGYGKQ